MSSFTAVFSFLYTFTGKMRSRPGNRQIALFLAFLAGVINACGFLAFNQYIGNMSGVIANLADSLVQGQANLALSGICALISFGIGAAVSTVLIICSMQQQRLQSLYALPLFLEAVLLALLGLMGDSLRLYGGAFILSTISLLCFSMGLQNATITTMSQGEIRTTHLTGLITDISMELGKGLFSKLRSIKLHTSNPPCIQTIAPNIQKLELFLSLLGMFFLGGALGTFNFIYAGFHSIIPFALVLAALASLPILVDLRLLKMPLLEVK